MRWQETGWIDVQALNFKRLEISVKYLLYEHEKAPPWVWGKIKKETEHEQHEKEMSKMKSCIFVLVR